MVGRKTGYFVVLLLLLDPSCAFLAEKCNIDLDFQKLLKQGEIDAEYLLQAAKVLSIFFQENPILAHKYSSTNNLANEFFRKGTSIITTANMAYFGVAVYLGTVVLTSYCFLVHSRKQFSEAQFIEKKLNLIIKREVQPFLQYIETLLNKCTENGSVKAACQGVNFEDMKMHLKKLEDKIQNVLKEIKSLENQSREGEEQSKVFQTGAIVVSVIGIVAAPLVISSGLGVSIIAGSLSVAGTSGYIRFETSKENYKETLQLLKKMEDRAFESNEAIKILQTDLEIARRNGFGSTYSPRLRLQIEGEVKKIIDTRPLETENQPAKPKNFS